MAISQYDQPAQSSYVPIPFEALKQAGLAKEQRFLESEALQEGIETQLGTFDALGSVNIGSQSVETGGRKLVQDKVQGYLTQIQDVSGAYPDKSSPEYRGKLKNILSNLKRDMGPTGVFGIEQANIKEMKDFQEQLTKNPQLAANPHLLRRQYDRMLKYAEASKQGPARLDLSGPIGKGINVSEKLAGLMDKMNSSLISAPTVGPSANAPGFNELAQREGITLERATTVAKALILQSPELYNDLQEQALYAQQRGSKRTVGEMVNNMAATMGEMFKQDKLDFKLLQDPTAISRLKKKVDDSMDNLLTGNVVFAKTREGFRNDEALNTNINKIDAGLARSIEDKNAFIAKNGITDLNKPLDKNGIDRSTDMAAFDFQEQQLLTKRKDLQGLKAKAMHAAGLTEKYFNTAEFEKSIEKSKIAAGRLYDRTFDTPARAKEGTPEELSGKTREEWVEDNYQDMIDKIDPNYGKYIKSLQDLSKKGSFIAGVTDVPTSLIESPRLQLKTFAAGFDEARQKLTNSTTGLNIDSNDFEEYNFGQGEVDGWFFDENDGKLKLNYIVPSYDKKGEGKDAYPTSFMNVKTAAPSGFYEALVDGGAVKHLETIIYQQLFSELGAGGSHSGDGPITLGNKPDKEGDLDTRFLFQVSSPQFNPQGWRVEIPKSETNPGAIEHFATQAEAVSYMSTAYGIQIRNLIDNSKTKE